MYCILSEVEFDIICLFFNPKNWCITDKIYIEMLYYFFRLRCLVSWVFHFSSVHWISLLNNKIS